jgi:hypothetical protein
MPWKPDYAAPSDLAKYISDDTSEDDPLYAMYISTSSRAVDDFCMRQFGKTDAPEQRQYSAEWSRYECTYMTEIDDLQDPTGLAILDRNGNAVTDYTLLPRNAILKGKPYERIATTVGGLLDITADSWGWLSVPLAAKNATLLQAARLAKRKDSPFGVAGSPSMGSELRLLAVLDPDLRTSLSAYRRNWWAA